MKKNLKKTAIVAAIVAALAIQGASAQVVVANGDLIFGAETVNSGTAVGNDLEVDLGNIASFTTSAQLTLSNVSATDLGSALNATASGGNYATASNTYWSVVGTTGSSDVGPYFKKAVFLTLNTGNLAPSGYQTEQSSIAGAGTGLNGLTPTGNSNGEGAIVAAALGTSYSSVEGTTAGSGGSTFFGFAGSGATTFGSGGDLDLYALSPTSDARGTTTSNYELLGSFAYSSGGGLTFTGVSVVPEPSSYALMILGGAVLLWQIKRRKSANS